MTKKEPFPCYIRGLEPQRSDVAHLTRFSWGQQVLRLMDWGEQNSGRTCKLTLAGTVRVYQQNLS